MSDRLILELKSKFKNEIQFEGGKDKDKFVFKNSETKKILEDLQLTLQSLNYTKNEIKSILPLIVKETDDLSRSERNASFENLLKFAMNHLENDSSNIVR